MRVPLSRREFVHGGAAAVLSAAAYGRVVGANERVGVGFIGYGLIGKRHVLDFQAQPNVRMAAISEVHRGRLEEARSLIGGSVKAFIDFRKLLDDREVDAVVVSTPDHWHALMTMLACAAGKDVYVEKPLTLFVREGRWMIDVAQKHKRVVQVGTQQRSGTHYQRAKELIAAGHIGKICSVRMSSFRNIMPGYGSPPDQEPPRELDWNMWLGPAPWRKYNPNRCIYHFRWFWDYSGGQITNLGQHSLDIVHWYLGVSGPKAVGSLGGRFCLRDNGETPDTQDAIFEYPGWTASWSHREASRGQSPPYGLEFFGTKGSLAISRRGFVVTPDRQVAPESTVPQFTDAMPVGGPPRALTQPGSPDAGSTPLWTEAIKDESGDSRAQFQQHVRNFLDCVKSRQTPISDLESGHRVASACHLANLSLRLGRMIRWDPDKETVIGDSEAAKMLVRAYRSPWDQELRALEVG
jgi:predicted dehydrogenase